MAFTTAIGADVAPRKGVDTFDGKQFALYEPPDVPSFLAELKQQPDVLLAWDAPLTGPADPGGKTVLPRDFTQRPIERFFRGNYGFRVPKGVSVLPYSGCPHWTITQYMLGLPRTGPFSSDPQALPFRPLLSQSELADRHDGRPGVVEVHPAVAIWLWCRERSWPHDDWKYKGNPTRVQELWSLLNDELPCTQGLPAPAGDDQLDALVAWLLADKWLRRDGGVILLGDATTGSLLLPDVPGLAAAFEQFIAPQQ